MKVFVIYLNYHPRGYNVDNISNAGYPCEVKEYQILGIAKAINHGIADAKKGGFDAVVTLANDIRMPNDWLGYMVAHAKLIPETGMCGIHTVEGLEAPEHYNGFLIHRSFTAFGNVLIPMKAINAVGYFNEDYDPYGMQDGDFAYRLNKAGFMNYYIHGLRAEHLGHDAGNGTEYRKMKDEGLHLSGDKWKKWSEQYEQGDYIINYPQYEGEWTN